HTSSLFSVTATAPPALSTLSLHDALPILVGHLADIGGIGGELAGLAHRLQRAQRDAVELGDAFGDDVDMLVDVVAQRVEQFMHRSEEHTSELQSRENLVCRLLLEKKNKYR